jgi:hypothetical protein
MSRVRKGQRFRSLRDVGVLTLVAFKNPSSGGSDSTLPAGETVVIDDDPLPESTAVYATPERYGALEGRLVPQSDLSDPAYNFYTLIVPLDSLANDFAKVEGA